MESVGNGLQEGVKWQQCVGRAGRMRPVHRRCPTYFLHGENPCDIDSVLRGEGDRCHGTGPRLAGRLEKMGINLLFSRGFKNKSVPFLRYLRCPFFALGFLSRLVGLGFVVLLHDIDALLNQRLTRLYHSYKAALVVHVPAPS